MAIEISQNVPIDENSEFYQVLYSRGDPDHVYGNSVATLIKPEHNLAFRRGVLPIMVGKILGSAEMTPLLDGDKIFTTVFGIYDIEGIHVGNSDETTSMFFPCMLHALAEDIDDPQFALAAYHRNLTEQTNDILTAVGSAYRLAPVETVQ